MAYVAARINLDDELKLGVRDEQLKVRNPAELGFLTSPHGDALQRAVLIPNIDLEPFLNEWGIELHLTPHGNAAGILDVGKCCRCDARAIELARRHRGRV